MTESNSRYTRSVLLVGGLLPMAIAGGAALLATSWAGRLPAEVAIHWSGAADRPDGFAPLWQIPAMILVLTAGFSTVVVAASLAAGGGRRTNSRFLLAVGAWLATFLAVGLVGVLAMQLDRDDVSDVGGPLVPMLSGALLGVLVGVAAWFLAPIPPTSAEAEAEAVSESEPMDLDPESRVIWTTTSSASRGLMTAVVAIGAVLALVAFANTVEVGAAAWPLYFAPVLLLAVLGTLIWRIRIDDRGVSARAALGYPRFTVAAADIDAAAAVTVSPLADFGGWGIRFAGNGIGVILRAGEAVRISRSGRSDLTISTDDAARAAGLAEAVARRSRDR